MIGIYKITNPKGAVYIGQSVDIERRWKEYHRMVNNNQPLIYYSIKSYGIDAHSFEVLQECQLDELDGLEYKWWYYYDKRGKTLNCKVPMYYTTPSWVADEIERQILEYILILRIRCNLLERALVDAGFLDVYTPSLSKEELVLYIRKQEGEIKKRHLNEKSQRDKKINPKLRKYIIENKKHKKI